MMSSSEKILQLIKQGEGLELEFKEARNRLNRDVFETACAFMNRIGGIILVGVSDKGEIKGIDAQNAAQMKKDFVTAINNPQKISPPAYLSVDEIMLEDKLILRIYVPESSQVHRCNGRIYDRNEDSDLDITDHTNRVATLYQRKQAIFSENKVYPFTGLKDLRADLIEKCRKMAGLWIPGHPWPQMNDLELLQSAQLYQTDHETGKSGVTLAGILLLGQDNLILSVLPFHKTDLILRRIDLDRYDDRDIVATNLIDSYDRILAFVGKHLSDPFYLEGTNRMSLRDTIFREVASNILIHREYMNAFPAKLIIERGQVKTENASKPHGFGVLQPETFTPFPKNPVIAKFFRQIGRADELGSGMRKMMRYGKAYGGADPEMIEDDIFKIIVRYPDTMTYPERPAIVKITDQAQVTKGLESGLESGPESGLESGPESIAQKIVMALKNGPLSRSQLATALGHKSISGKLNLNIKKLLEKSIIEYTIPDKPNSRLQKYRLTEKGRKEKTA